MKAPKTNKPATINTLIPKAATHFSARPFHAPQDNQQEEQKENKTGLPDRLKAGIENMSGISLDDVKVFYNSSKPAQLQAYAFTQGTNIHVVPGHEKYLPHEAWHVVQQKQGRVRPTMQMREMFINDDLALENEANTQGTNAIQNKNMNRRITTYPPQQNNPVVQLGRKRDKKGKNASKKTAESREAGRAARYASRNPEKAGKPTVFGNEEGRLPKAGKGQHYIETDVGAGRNNRGKRRIVSLIESGTGRMFKQYNTDDHYETFH